MNTTKPPSDPGCDRRDFLKYGTVGLLGMGWGNYALENSAFADESPGSFGAPTVRPLESVRIGFVGVGDMGACHVRNLLTGTAPDMDVYDAAALSAVSALSERSLANMSAPVDFPDFTRGNWKERPPLGIISG